MDSESKTNNDFSNTSKKVSRSELNSWRRGFTPQAEIWNGRMASIGLILLFGILLISNFLFGS